MKQLYVIVAFGFAIVFIVSYAFLSNIDSEKVAPTYIEKTVVVPVASGGTTQN